MRSAGSHARYKTIARHPSTYGLMVRLARRIEMKIDSQMRSTKTPFVTDDLRSHRVHADATAQQLENAGKGGCRGGTLAFPDAQYKNAGPSPADKRPIFGQLAKRSMMLTVDMESATEAVVFFTTTSIASPTVYPDPTSAGALGVTRS